MKKWEHLALVQLWSDDGKKFYWGDDKTDERGVTERLNALGAEGWELVTLDRGYLRTEYGRQFFLKRPIS